MRKQKQNNVISIILNTYYLKKQYNNMSIYSGFATRQQQQCYDQCLQSILFILQKRLIKFYKNQQANQQKFITSLTKLHHQLKSMQTRKYLLPKSSNTFTELIAFLKNKDVQDTKSIGKKQSEFCYQHHQQIQYNDKDGINNMHQIQTTKNGDNRSLSRQQTTTTRVYQSRLIPKYPRMINRDTNNSLSQNVIPQKTYYLSPTSQYDLLPQNTYTGYTQHLLNSHPTKLSSLPKTKEPLPNSDTDHSLRNRRSSLRFRQKYTESNNGEQSERSRLKNQEIQCLLQQYMIKRKRTHSKNRNKTKHDMEQLYNF